MVKSSLETLIKKYYLAGLNDTAKWTVNLDAKTLIVESSTPNTLLITNLQLDNFTELVSCEFGINDTTKLLRMLNVLGEDINITATIDNSTVKNLILKDPSIEVQYVAADLKVKFYGYKQKLPDFAVEIVVDRDFIDTYILSKSALNDVEQVTFTMNGDNKLSMVFGLVMSENNKMLNTSKIKYLPKTLPGKDILAKPISYNATYLKEIFYANKDCDSTTLRISDNSLCHVEFKKGDVTAKYYLAGIIGN